MSEDRKYLIPSEIMSADDLQPEDVHVPEWGGYVKLRPLTAAEALQFTDAAKKDKENSNLRILVMSAITPEGSPLFTLADVKQLQQKSLRAIMRIQRAALRLNGLKEEEVAKEEAKND